ncbi:hypothetical protein O6H91_01G077000 [Diphasiastrum complanatum]|uniref:Uncharacterized protein n=1 Tax=Diphasiastrum complanatum TaxID=34168 RepID=A0ACC2ES60_DIPCM|nr:hypothetical protein O6H91_01G077000 [Diphasiastrum complanatum]
MASIAAAPSSSTPLVSHPAARRLWLFDPSSLSSLSKVCVQVTSSCTCSQVSDNASGRSRNPLSHCHSQQISRRKFSIPLSSLSLATLLIWQSQGRVWADVIKNEDTGNANSNVFRGLESFLDPTEVTKSGKKLPKSYVQSAREVVRALRESLKEDAKDEEKFRRSGDSAKEAIRVYLSSWRGSKELASQSLACSWSILHYLRAKGSLARRC